MSIYTDIRTHVLESVSISYVIKTSFVLLCSKKIKWSVEKERIDDCKQKQSRKY